MSRASGEHGRTPEHLRALERAVHQRTLINRRRFMTVAGGALLFSATGGMLGCGGDSSSSRGGASPSKQLDSGQITLGGYPDWIGKHELDAFAAANPGSSVKQLGIAVDQERIAKLAT